MRIRVLHFFNKMDLGGAETFVMNIYRNINRDLVQFDFAVESEEVGFYDEEIKKLGGRIFILPSPKKNLLNYVIKVKKILKDENFKVVHSHVHLFSGINLLIAKLCGVNKRIAHSHTYSQYKKRGLLRKLYEGSMKLLIHKTANEYLGCSERALKDLFLQSNIKTNIIYNGIDIKKFLDNDLNKDEAKMNIGLNENDFIIGHVGAFRAEKNHEFIFDIFEEFLQYNASAKLVLVGDGKLKNKILNILSEKEYKHKVYLLGNRKNIEAIYKAFDIFIFPSLYEGLGMAAIEAQLSGLNCVLSDCVPKDVDITGNVSFLSLSDEKTIWVEHLKKNRPVYSLEKDSVEHYDIKNVCENLLDIYGSEYY